MSHSTKDIRRIQRGCTDKEMRKLILDVIYSGVRYKMTKSGVMFYTAEGSASAHLTGSDHRGLENFRKTLKTIGIIIEKGK